MRKKPYLPHSFLLPLLLLALFAALPGLSACASRDVNAPSREEIEAHRDELNARAQARTFTETSAPYLQGRLVSLAHDVRDSAILQTKVTLKQKGTLAEIAASLSRLAPVSAQVASPEDIALSASPQASPAVPGLEGILPDDAAGIASLASLAPLPAGFLDISYTGTLAGLLDTIASMSGYGWDWEEKRSRITFSAMQVRTFVVQAPVGEVAWESQVSNKSREQRTTSLGSGSSISFWTGSTGPFWKRRRKNGRCRRVLLPPATSSIW